MVRLLIYRSLFAMILAAGFGSLVPQTPKWEHFMPQTPKWEFENPKWETENPKWESIQIQAPKWE